MEVVVAGGGRTSCAFCHDLDRSHAEIKLDETKKKKWPSASGRIHLDGSGATLP